MGGVGTSPTSSGRPAGGRGRPSNGKDYMAMKETLRSDPQKSAHRVLENSTFETLEALERGFASSITLIARTITAPSARLAAGQNRPKLN